MIDDTTSAIFIVLSSLTESANELRNTPIEPIFAADATKIMRDIEVTIAEKRRDTEAEALEIVQAAGGAVTGPKTGGTLKTITTTTRQFNWPRILTDLAGASGDSITGALLLAIERGAVVLEGKISKLRPLFASVNAELVEMTNAGDPKAVADGDLDAPHVLASTTSKVGRA